ncbi:O-antigen ligase [Microbacterium sp. cx-59]|uniref:O-antigen ligase family protein n=1 Tax=Microbacterium sp. cx-59 TaxID=2891207 RepID=UPI001E632394|nr:O-antigen ligase family protein [Microbacterium sp. cx-59]MCC4908024.1 O-antigen ligase family protein [Microbacterium sp. cx-59]
MDAVAGARYTPIAASRHSVSRRPGMDAVSMLTVYIVLLYGFPSNLALSFLGSYGRPQFLWGLVLLLWWVLSRFQPPTLPRSVSQPVRLALCVLLVVFLLSFAQAMLRGQPADQISPAVSSLARLLSWTGVALVAMDGIRTMDELMTLVRRVALAGGLVAALGLLQFATDQPIIDFLSGLPGFSGDAGGIDSRGGFIRASGTATHPLEYAIAISVALPLAVASAIIGDHGHKRLRWWLPVMTVAMASFLAVSRSAVIGFIVATVAVIPGLPRRFRGVVMVVVVTAFVGAMLTVPGLYGTIVGMFLGIGTDTSTQSRTVALDLAPQFLASSPLLGAGTGTFLPRYRIFDNEWIHTAVEVGILGVAALAALFAVAIWSAWRASRESSLEDLQVVGRCLAACVVTIAVLFSLFDAFAFPMAPGTAFLIFGLCAAARTVGRSDRWLSHTWVAELDGMREFPPPLVPVAASRAGG